MTNMTAVAVSLLVVGLVLGAGITEAALPAHTITSVSTSTTVSTSISTVPSIVLATVTSTVTGPSTTIQTFLSTTTVTTSVTQTTTETFLSTVTTTVSSENNPTITIPQGVGTDQSLNFSPSSLTVTSGTTVTFVDDDTTAPHNIWFTSIPSGATNPNTAAGQSSFYELVDGNSVSYTLTTPGTYDFECQFHSTWMQGVITVVGSTTTTTASSSSTTTSSSSAYVIVMPQGAGSGLNFSPSTITIPAGATITFMDEDSIAPHNVWFTSIPAGAADPNTSAGQQSGYELVKGQSVSYILTTPGTYAFECQFHSSWMLGTITVS